MLALLLACAGPAPAPPPAHDVDVPGVGVVSVREPAVPATGLVVALGAPMEALPADLRVIAVPDALLRAQAEAAAGCWSPAALSVAVVAAAASPGAESVLYGRGWTAAAAYAALAEAPDAGFLGAVAEEFCPTFDGPRPPCPGPGWTPGSVRPYDLPPARDLGPGRVVVVRACTPAVSWLAQMGPAAHNAPTPVAALRQALRATRAR